MNRHLVSINDLTKDDAILILDTAKELAQVSDRPVKKLPTLRGRTIVNLFFEDSTRTRISFEAAAKRLSADVINFSAKGSSVSKGESLKDTAERVIPYFKIEIEPKLKEGKNIVIAAHGNSLRALIMYLENMSPEQILEFEIGTAIPRFYDLDENLKVKSVRNL
ncbi:MAG: 2,3-bisphosphoglycerate-dependent phosphoglycerate mutase [Actinomycetes bacterium]